MATVTTVVVDHALALSGKSEDPFSFTMLWQSMYDVTRGYGQKGTGIEAVRVDDGHVRLPLGKGMEIRSHREASRVEGRFS